MNKRGAETFAIEQTAGNSPTWVI